MSDPLGIPVWTSSAVSSDTAYVFDHKRLAAVIEDIGMRPNHIVMSPSAHKGYVDVTYWTPRAQAATGQVAPFVPISFGRLKRWAMRGLNTACRRVKDAWSVLRKGYVDEEY